MIGFCILFFSSFVFAQETNLLDYQGQLLERGTQVPLSQVNLFLLPLKLKATTDASGSFIFSQVPEGIYKVVVNFSGYEKLEQEIRLPSRPNVKLYLERTSYTQFETRVVGQKKKRDESTQTLSRQVIASLPGAEGDPVKAVQNLPGVNRSGFSSQVIIQGSAPQDTKYDIDGHEIPLVFHFGGLTSVIMPEAVEQVDYLSAGYGAEYSRAMGGEISLKTRSPENQRKLKGLFFVDITKSGGLIEGPIDDTSSFLLSGRYSYIGLLLKEAAKGSDQLDLTVAPAYSDITGVYKKKLSEKDQLKVTTVASRDTLGFVLKEPVRGDPSFRGNFESETSFYRFIPAWERKESDARTYRFSVGAGQDLYNVNIGSDRYFKNRVNVLTTRGEWEEKLGSQWVTQWGFDNEYSRAALNIRLPNFRGQGGVNNPVSTAETREVNMTSRFDLIGLYWRNEFEVDNEKWVLRPAFRFDHFSQTKESFVAPRFSTSYKLTPSLSLKAAVGVYYQPPQPQETDESFGNPNVKSPSADHSVLGFEKDLRGEDKRGVVLSLSYFEKRFKKLVVQSTGTRDNNGTVVPEIYNNSGSGKAHGIESMLRYDFDPFTGWISYTYSRSTRSDPVNGENLFQYDQTHNLNVIASYNFGKNWTASGRYRYVTGNPYTPVASSTFDSDHDVFIPTRGPLYSERMEAFQQLDVRVDKKFIVDQEIWSLYIDIQNILNQKNAETLRYSYDYSVKENVTGLPILPAIGIKGEF